MAARKPATATQAQKSESVTVGQTIARLRANLTIWTKHTVERLEKTLEDFRAAVAGTGSVAHAIEWKGQEAIIAERVLSRAGKVMRIVAGLEPMPEAASVTIDVYLADSVAEIERNLLENGHYLNQSTCPLRNVAIHCDHQAEIQVRKIYKDILKELKELARLSQLDPNAAD